jgi:Tfp pilus assembly protein PilX
MTINCNQLHDSGRKNERGVALIITLLILALVTVLSLGMIIAFSSQTLIGGFYRNYRGAFYAADSGLNVARQKVQAELVASVPATFVFPPVGTSCGAASSVTVATDYASTTSLNTGSAAQSWNEGFKITNAVISAPVMVSNVAAQTYTCTYSYNLTSVGTAQGSEQQTVTETGNMVVSVAGASAVQNVSFSYFGAFVDKYPGGTGPLVPGTMTGPMFTNDAWEFMAAIPPWTAPYIFTDPVGQVGSQVDYWDSGWGQHWSATNSWGSGANLVAPTFEQGLNLNQPSVPLPTNDFNQVEAVIDGKGNVSGETQAMVNAGLATLQNVSGSGYTGTAVPGVFFNKGTTSGTGTGQCAAGVTPPCVAGGGFYVEGAADVQLVPVSGSSTAQTYNITQGGVLTTITIDPAANSGVGTTVVTQGGTTQTLNGVPMNTSATAQAATMIYVDGTTTVHGPGEGQGAVQDNAMITLAVNGDIVATGDVLYKTEPVSIPSDAIIPAVQNMNQVLGLYTANGNFITQDAQADQNIQVDGSIATISATESSSCGSPQKGGQLSNGHINTFNNVGGMIQSCIYAADVNTENTWFDRRFTARTGFAPPWFPSTHITTGGPLPTNTSSKVQRVQWVNTSSE